MVYSTSPGLIAGTLYLLTLFKQFPHSYASLPVLATTNLICFYEFGYLATTYHPHFKEEKTKLYLSKVTDKQKQAANTRSETMKSVSRD